jgi:hypothetical protein
MFENSWGSEGCIVLRLNPRPYEEKATLNIAFPFHEDMPNIHLEPFEALSLRNAIDELFAIKALPMPVIEENGDKDEPNLEGVDPFRAGVLLNLSAHLIDRMTLTPGRRITPDEMKFVIHHMKVSIETAYPHRKD